MKVTWCGFASRVGEEMQAYLQHKRTLQRKFQTEESVLRLLDRHNVPAKRGA